MAKKITDKNYPYAFDSETTDPLTTENINEESEEEDDDDDDLTETVYPISRQSQVPSILYNYKNGQQHLSPPLPSTTGSSRAPAQFDVLTGDLDDDGEHTSELLSGFTPPTPVTIQRVSSEDEMNFCSKRKRAKFVGPYLFGDVIGQGSYAKVKECLDQRNLCRRAVKIMQRRRLRRTPHGEKMAATEIRILKKLSHPNIIKLYDFIRNDEKQKLYLFIDLCVVSLQEMLDSMQAQRDMKSFPLWQAHGYFVQLIHGLEYLHSKFIIHNDIKPGNLLITVDHQLKITDFGTAEQLDMFSPDDTIKKSQGTPAFQCPEIANGEDTYRGFCVDIWSCGVTLYNLVTGTLPFEANNIYLLFQIIGKGDYTIPDDIDPRLASLLRGLLNSDKNARLTIEQIKLYDWFRRRPPRTFDFVPFPPAHLNRFQFFTMYDYLAELHQTPTNTPDINDHPEVVHKQESNNVPAGSITVVNSPHDHQQNAQMSNVAVIRARRRNRSLLNCGCNRTTSSDTLHVTSKRPPDDHRICLLS